MKRFISALLIIVTIISMTVIPAQASEGWITNKFEFGSFAPVVKFSIKGFEDKLWVTVDNNGYLTSTSNKDKARNFVILPAEEQGYYIIRDTNNPYLTLTFTPKGFRLMSSPENKYAMPIYQNNQKYKFIWKSNYPQGYNDRKCSGWHLQCKSNKMIVSDVGYSVLGMWRTNNPD